jgi:hypothetical protein
VNRYFNDKVWGVLGTLEVSTRTKITVSQIDYVGANLVKASRLRLLHLDIPELQSGVFSLSSLATLVNLRILLLTTTEIGAAGFLDFLYPMRQLRFLQLSSCIIDEFRFVPIVSTTSINTLVLNHPKRISKLGLRKLVRLGGTLERLSISADSEAVWDPQPANRYIVDVRDMPAATLGPVLQRLTSLKAIHLSRDLSDPIALHHLQSLTKLEQLHIYCGVNIEQPLDSFCLPNLTHIAGLDNRSLGLLCAYSRFPIINC